MTKDENILNVVKWWEKKRLIYNITVCISGLLGLILSKNLFLLIFLFQGVILYAIVANVCFSLGWSSFVLRLYYTKNHDANILGRKIWFYTGLGFSVILTFTLAYFHSDTLFLD